MPFLSLHRRYLVSDVGADHFVIFHTNVLLSIAPYMETAFGCWFVFESCVNVTFIMSLLWFQAQALSSLSVYLPSYPVTYLLWYMFVKTACNGHKVHGYSCVLQAKSFELVHKSCYVSTCFFYFVRTNTISF